MTAAASTFPPRTAAPVWFDRGLVLTLREAFCACLLLYYAMVGYIPVLMPNKGGALTASGDLEQAHSVNHIVRALVWALVFVLVARSWSRIRFDYTGAKWALIYVAWAAVSILWSAAPGSTFSATLSLFAATALAFYLLSAFDQRRLSVIFSWVFGTVAVASAVFAILLPEYGVDHFSHQGSWQGIFDQKNTLGMAMTYGLAVALAFRPSSLPQRLWRAFLFCACAVVLLESGSREAWVAAGFLLVLHVAARLMSNLSRPLIYLATIGGLMIGALVAAAAVTYGPMLLMAMNRDTTLTGRTQIWNEVLRESSKNPIIGYGLSGFWGSPESNNAYVVLHWYATSAHNGFLESLVELGAVGLGLMLVVLFIGIWAAWRTLKRGQLAGSLLPLYLFSTMILLNTTAAILSRVNDISWILFLVCVCLFEQNARRAAPQAAVKRTAVVYSNPDPRGMRGPAAVTRPLLNA